MMLNRKTKHYVINLKESTERWQRTSEALCGYTVERIEAVNGRELDLDSVDLSVLARANLRNKTKHSHLEIDGLGAVGAYLSHVECWKRIAAHGPAIVLEDDVVLLPSFGKIQFEGDLVFLGHGYKEHPTKGIEKIKGWAQGGELHLGSYGYYMTPHAALYMLKSAFPIVLSVDHYLWAYPDTRHVNAVSVHYHTSPTITHFPLLGFRPVWHLNVTIIVLIVYILLTLKSVVRSVWPH